MSFGCTIAFAVPVSSVGALHLFPIHPIIARIRVRTKEGGKALWQLLQRELQHFIRWPGMRDLVDLFCLGVRAAKETGASSADTIAAFAEALRKIYRPTKPTQAAAEYGFTAEIAEAGIRCHRIRPSMTLSSM